MRKFIVPVVLAVFVLAAAFIAIEVAVGQAADPKILKREVQGESVREIAAPPTGEAPQQPDISFIDSPSATCYQPDHTQNVCYIAWYYLSVDAGANYMISSSRKREMSLAQNNVSQIE